MEAFLQSLKAADPVAIILIITTLIVFVIPVFILFPPLPVESFDVLGQTHSKAGVPLEQSNLPRQAHSKERARRDGPPRVESLWIYPVKSCAGIELARSNVLPTGLEHDRLYTFGLREEDDDSGGSGGEGLWKFQTLRQWPLLANVEVELWLPDEAKQSRALGRPRDGFLVVKFPWASRGLRGLLELLTAKLSRGMRASPHKEFLLPLGFPTEAERRRRGYEYRTVKIWKDVVSALDMASDVPKELGAYLGVREGTRLALFRMDPEKRREVFRNAPRKESLGYQPVVDFQDAYPLHLLTLDSLADLEAKVEKDAELSCLDPRRFRANIITSGSEPYDEDTWRGIRCIPASGQQGEPVAFDVSARMVRCKLPNVDPDTGIRHRTEPDKTMRKLRDVDEGAPKLGCFGMSLCPVFPKPDLEDDRIGVISVGMEVQVDEERKHHVYKKL